MAAIGIELWHHEHLNRQSAGPFFRAQMTLVFAVFLLLFAARPICPRGRSCLAVAAALGVHRLAVSGDRVSAVFTAEPSCSS